MPYVTSFERLAKEEGREEGWQKGREEGREEGLKHGIRAVLSARFGEEGLLLMPEIDAIRDPALIETIVDQANRVASPEELRECWK